MTTKFGENTTIAQISRIVTMIAAALTVVSIVGGVLWTQRAQVVFLTSFAERLDRDMTKLESDTKARFAEIASIATRQAEVAQALLVGHGKTETELAAIRRDLASLAQRMTDLERAK